MVFTFQAFTSVFSLSGFGLGSYAYIEYGYIRQIHSRSTVILWHIDAQNTKQSLLQHFILDITYYGDRGKWHQRLKGTEK